MKRFIFLLAAICTACISSTPVPLVRTTIPATAPEHPLQAPVPEKTVMPNGLTMLSVTRAGLPITQLDMVLRVGAFNDPAEKPGLAAFTASMLNTGTTTRSAAQIEDLMAKYGSSLNISIDEDSTTLSATVLSEYVPEVIAVMADVIQHPAFAADEITRMRKQRLAELEHLEADPSSKADDVFQHTVYGKHPYAHAAIGNKKALESITRKDLVGFHARWFTPQASAVIVVSDLSTGRIQEWMNTAFGPWQGKNLLARTLIEQPPQAKEALTVIDRPGAVQSQVRMGHIAVPRNHPDYYPLLICNAILGGLFNSRINMNLREDKGYTYGARSQFDFRVGPGPFVVSTGVHTEVTGPALREIVKEIALIRTEAVHPDELQAAIKRYSLSLPGQFQTVEQTASMFVNLFIHDLPLDYYSHLPAELAKVTAQDVLRVARAHLDPAKMTVVIVGDKAKVEKTIGAPVSSTKI